MGLKGKAGLWDVSRWLWKALTSSWASRRPYIHDTQKTPEKVLNSHICLMEAWSKGRGGYGFELHACNNTHTKSPGKNWETYRLQTSEEITVKSLAGQQANWRETSVSYTHTHTHTLQNSFRKVTEHPNNSSRSKQQYQETPGRMAESELQSFHILSRNIPVINKELHNMLRNRKAWPTHRQRNSQQKLHWRKSRYWTYEKKSLHQLF